MQSRHRNTLSTPAKQVLLAALATTLGACATVPAPLQGQFAPVTPREAVSGNQVQVANVRWGGEIINVDPRAGETCFEILAHDLDSVARPITRDASAGRFLACRSGFYDPEEFDRGRDITIVGHLDGSEKGKIGEFDYTYPRVAADAVYLWPERPTYAYPPYPYDPWGPWWGGGPYWGGPWWGTTVIVDRPHHHH
jgi:outer membrane lipoprotein